MPETARHPILYQLGIIGAFPAGRSPGVEYLSETAEEVDSGLGFGASEVELASTSSTFKVGMICGPLGGATGTPTTELAIVRAEKAGREVVETS
jgi:hypothetical protein